MIFPDRKKIASVIVAKMHKPEDGGAPERVADGGDLKALARDMLDALKSDSEDDFAHALSAFICQHEVGEDEGYE